MRITFVSNSFDDWASIRELVVAGTPGFVHPGVVVSGAQPIVRQRGERGRGRQFIREACDAATRAATRYHRPMRAWSLFVATLGVNAGCDLLFRIDNVAAPGPDGQPLDARVTDAPPPDPPSNLMCSGGQIVLHPTVVVTSAWANTVPDNLTPAQAVAEADGDMSYVASKQDAAFELFGHLPVSGSMNIDSVVVWARARVDVTPGFMELGVALTSGSTISSEDRQVTTSYSDYSSRGYALDPHTNLPWTVDGVNSMTFGVRKSYADVTARVTKVWAVVTCH